jgi:putative transposase
MNNPLIKQQEEYNKITDLVNLIKSNPDPRELKRALAIKMSIEKQSDEIIAQILGVSKSFIRDWKKAFKAEGIAGIKLGYQGAKGKLTSEQRIEIIEWLKNKNYWHLDELMNHLEDKYDVVYKSKQSYYDLFEQGRVSWKRSQKVNPKFDEDLVKNLQRRYQHKKIVLIWDGASYHRFGEFREYLAQVNQDKLPDNLEITCILFAPNAPQQNPVEDIWLQGKNFLRKHWYLCKHFWAVKKLFELFYDCSKFDFLKIDRYHFSQELN